MEDGFGTARRKKACTGRVWGVRIRWNWSAGLVSRDSLRNTGPQRAAPIRFPRFSSLLVFLSSSFSPQGQAFAVGSDTRVLAGPFPHVFVRALLATFRRSFRQEDLPVCVPYAQHFSMEYILIHCIDLAELRQCFYDCKLLRMLFGSASVYDIIGFLKTDGLFYRS